MADGPGRGRIDQPLFLGAGPRSPMNRLPPLILAVVGLVICAQAAAQGLLQGGYDEATRKLEEGFKIVATERIGSDSECYPAPDEIAAVLRREMGLEVVVAPTLDSVQGFDQVNMIKGA